MYATRFGILVLVLASLLCSRLGLAEGFKEAPLDAVRGQLESARQARAAFKTVRDQLDDQLSELELRQGQLAQLIMELETQARDREKHIQVLKQRRDKTLAHVRQQQKTLSEQLRSAHLVGREDWLKLLMNQEEPTRMARVLAYYGYLSVARSALIQRLKDELVQVDQTEKELQQETLAKTELRKKSQQERQQLLEATKARKVLLSSWDEELKSQAVRIRELKEDEERLAHLVDSFSTANEARVSPAASAETQMTTRGRCPPVGPIVSRFGSKRLNGRWDGILIGGREGSPVKTVAAGKVAFADWFRGYGLLTIIDHGAGVMSLYAFNQSLSKTKGDEVVAGEVIATLGASGGREAPGLYFGIRNQGKPVDPIAWCKTQT